MSTFTVEVEKAEVLCVENSNKPNEFVLINLETRQVWPITKAGMLALANNLDSWFKEIASRPESK